jgi:cytochrome c oxidase cbb3-type subunit 3
MKINWNNTKMKAVALASMAVILPFMSMAAEGKHTPAWRGIVSANDTPVFWALAGLAVLLLVLTWVVAAVTKALVSDKGIWKDKLSASAKNVAALVGISLVASSTTVFAQSAEGAGASGSFQMSDDLFWMMIAVNAFLAVVLLALLYNLSNLIASLKREEKTVAGEAKVTLGFWEGSLSEAVPIEQEADILLDHEYDGIRELDNKLPPWWLYMFYATIVFGFVYLGYYQFTPGNTQQDEYEAQLVEAAAEKAAYLAKSGAAVDENTATVLTGAAVENGKKTFESLCVACHGPSGGSSPNGVGPNLTDEHWINGGGINNIFKVIKYGVPTKGMIAWESQLTPVQIQEVSSYIVSLQGSNPENAKEPQGEIWKEGAAVSTVEAEEVPAEVVEVEEIKLLKDKASLASGKKVFDAMCVACHAATGGSNPGGIGPNLTDEYWLNGGGVSNVYHTIKFGVPAKGMIPWEGTLTPQQMQETASYIISLGGTKPKDAKEPQGDKWEGK